MQSHLARKPPDARWEMELYKKIWATLVEDPYCADR